MRSGKGSKMKILDTLWYINCGIVRVEDEYEGIKYYIRGLQANEWSTPEIDARVVADWGSTFPKEVGDILFGVDPLRDGSSVQIPVSVEQAKTMVAVGMSYLESRNET